MTSLHFLFNNTTYLFKSKNSFENQNFILQDFQIKKHCIQISGMIVNLATPFSPHMFVI